MRGRLLGLASCALLLACARVAAQSLSRPESVALNDFLYQLLEANADSPALGTWGWDEVCITKNSSNWQGVTCADARVVSV